jgi:hypothetical protein
MKPKPACGALHIALVLVCSIVSSFTPLVARAAGPWYVAPGGSDASDCLSPATACATINAAITKAAAGETVNVATGTYTPIFGTGEVVLINKSINLQGGWDAAFTSQTGMSTIDGQVIWRGITARTAPTAVN